MYWQIWPWCFKILRPSKIFTGPGLLAVVFHKPWLVPDKLTYTPWYIQYSLNVETSKQTSCWGQCYYIKKINWSLVFSVFLNSRQSIYYSREKFLQNEYIMAYVWLLVSITTKYQVINAIWNLYIWDIQLHNAIRHITINNAYPCLI